MRIKIDRACVIRVSRDTLPGEDLDIRINFYSVANPSHTTGFSGERLMDGRMVFMLLPWGISGKCYMEKLLMKLFVSEPIEIEASIHGENPPELSIMDFSHTERVRHVVEPKEYDRKYFDAINGRKKP